jgi:hypothetical protein
MVSLSFLRALKATFILLLVITMRISLATKLLSYKALIIKVNILILIKE